MEISMKRLKYLRTSLSIMLSAAVIVTGLPAGFAISAPVRVEAASEKLVMQLRGGIYILISQPDLSQEQTKP